MSAKSLAEPYVEKKTAEPMDTLLEVNENVPSEVFDRPFEEGIFQEIEPKIFGLKSITEPLTIPSLNNAIYELGVVDLCWPDITEPVFETRTCFPKSYYTNSTKERLLLAYAENFRRQFQFHYKARKPLFFQAPNECGLQKMVCTSIRPTKLCYAHTNTWQGVASLVADFFNYEPLTKCMLHETLSSPESQKVEVDLDPLDNDLTSDEESTGSDVPLQMKYNRHQKMRKDVKRKEDKKIPTKRILRQYDNLLTRVESVAKDVNKHVEQSENEFEIFGKSIAVQLKNMPLDKAVEAQMFIQNYLSNMRLKSLNKS